MQLPITLNGRFLTQDVTGVQRVARELLFELDNLAMAGELAVPRLLVPGRGELVDPPELSAISIERIGRRGGHLWEQIDLPRAAGSGVLLCLGNTAPLLRLRRRGLPTVVMVHDLSYKYFPTAYSRSFRLLYGIIMPQVLRHADRIVTVSRAEFDAMAQCYPFLLTDPRFSFAPNGGLTDQAMKAAVAAPQAKASGRTSGLYVGSLTRRKNAAGILTAAATFLRAHPEMSFTVVGATDSSFKSIDIDVPTEVRNRITFIGHVNDTGRLGNLYSSARFLLFPSFYESSGLPPSEAMAFGCPTVASDIPALFERCGDAAIYCDPHNSASISAAIELLMDDKIWSEKARLSTERAGRFSWAKQAQHLLQLCEDIA